MSDQYTLYGSYASYYTAKVRSYLRKKGVPFVERLPAIRCSVTKCAPRLAAIAFRSCWRRTVR